jgi:hypothetical protein
MISRLDPYLMVRGEVVVIKTHEHVTQHFRPHLLQPSTFGSFTPSSTESSSMTSSTLNVMADIHFDLSFNTLSFRGMHYFVLHVHTC